MSTSQARKPQTSQAARVSTVPTRTTNARGRARALGLLLAAGTATLAGCESGPSGMPREFAATLQQVATSMSDQAVWDRIIGGVAGQAIEPGIEGYAGVLYVAGGKITGFSGQVDLRGEGRGSGALSPEARAALLALARAPNTPIEIAERILAAIGVNAGSAPPPQAIQPPEITIDPPAHSTPPQ